MPIDADLEDAYFSDVWLRGANLSGAYLVNARVRGYVLEYINFSGANLSAADLFGNSFLRPNFSNACLENADLERAKLSNANLSGANLSGANLSEAVLVGADLSGANLHKANLNNADLSYADLSFANLVGANINAANLNQAELNGATLDDPECEYVYLEEDAFAKLIQTNAEELNLNIKALGSEIQEKWKAIATKTEPLDRQKAANSIKAIYALYNKPEPEIIFCDSPLAALKLILGKLTAQLLHQTDPLGKPFAKPNERLWKPLQVEIQNLFGKSLFDALGNKLGKEITQKLKHQLRSELSSHLWELVVSQLGEEKWRQLGEEVWRQAIGYLDNCICPELWAARCAVFEFYRTISNLYSDAEQWEIFESLMSNCGWIFAFEKVCVLCDRPIKLNFDTEERLHALGEAAIEFADGYKIYCYGGVPLPEKYGSKHPQNWQPEWYLEEPIIPLRRILIEAIPPEKLSNEWYLKETDFQLKQLLIEAIPPQNLKAELLLSEYNAELRRRLIQRIGYARICQELKATELDEYLEYTLLKIDANIDREQIYILKMTCPSTGAIHALRVPPDTISAREAIRWVNWGIDPEEFSQQA